MKTGAAVLVAAALSACSPPSLSSAARAAAITNGSLDGGDAGVAALMQGATLSCTATLIAPRLLVTAAHCLAGESLPQAYFGSAPGDGGPMIALAAVRTHPAFDPSTLANDVAMALLADDAPAGVTPSPLPPAPLDDRAVGAPLRLVGFGRTAAGDTSPPAKRAGTTTIASLSPTELTFGASPSQTCEGDSGGPAFATVGGVEALVGVTSSGDAACAQMGRDMRIDAYVDSFLAPWMAATAESAASAGERCWYDGNCAAGAGACAPALDDATLSFCAPACDGGCPAGLACLADGAGERLCRHAPPSPGAAGASCSDDGACAAGRCVARQSGGDRVCATTCFPDLPGFCGAGFACVAVAGGGDAACFATRAGGCAFVGVGDGEVGAALLFFALSVSGRAAARRRRWSRRRSRTPRGWRRRAAARSRS